jgi:multiple sugar transport system substrate-binding protein
MVASRPTTRRSVLKGALGGAALATAATAPTRAAAAPAFLQQGKLTLEYWQAFRQFDAVIELFERFNQASPGIRIEGKLYADYLELTQAVQAAFAAGRPPALAGVGYDYLRYAAANLPHLTIAEAIARDPAGNAFLSQGFPENILALGRLDGVQHGMPFVIGMPYLFYNLDLFDRAGVAEGPRTWADLREISRTIKEETGAFGLYMEQTRGIWTEQALVESNGGKLLIEEGGVFRTGIDGPESVEAWQLYADLVLEDQTAAHLEFRQGEQAFNAGQVAMMIASGDSLRAAAEAGVRLGSVPFPTFGDKPRRVPVGGNNFFIFAQDEAAQRAAWEFVKFVNTPESLTLYTEDAGYPPAMTALIDDSAYLAPYYEANPLVRPELAQLADAVPWTSWPGDSGLEIVGALVDMRERILLGSQAVPAAVAETAEQVNALIAG